MTIVDIESSDEEGDRGVKVYPRDELMRIGANSDTTIELPSWTCGVLSEHPDCGHIIFPFITEALEEEPDLTLPWDTELLEDLKQSDQRLEEDLALLSDKLEISSVSWPCRWRPTSTASSPTAKLFPTDPSVLALPSRTATWMFTPTSAGQSWMRPQLNLPTSGPGGR